MADRVSNKAQELKGRAKQAAGKASGNRKLEAEGKAEAGGRGESRPADRAVQAGRDRCQKGGTQGEEHLV